MHHNDDVDSGNYDAPRAEAELLPQVRHLIDEPEGVALTPPLDASQPQQPDGQRQSTHQPALHLWTVTAIHSWHQYMLEGVLVNLPMCVHVMYLRVYLCVYLRMYPPPPPPPSSTYIIIGVPVHYLCVYLSMCLCMLL